MSKEELRAYHKALEAVIAEATRLYKAGVPVDDAVKQANFGEYASWTLAKSQGPIADSQGVRGAVGETPMSSTMALPSFADVESAAQQIAGAAHRTPVATSRARSTSGPARTCSSSARTCSAAAPSSSAAPTTRSRGCRRTKRGAAS